MEVETKGCQAKGNNAEEGATVATETGLGLKNTKGGENVSDTKGADGDGANEGGIKNGTVEASEKLKEKEEEKSISKAEAEVEALKMLEFYFGDSNFNWDRFMQSKVRFSNPLCKASCVFLNFINSQNGHLYTKYVSSLVSQG